MGSFFPPLIPEGFGPTVGFLWKFSILLPFGSSLAAQPPSINIQLRCFQSKVNSRLMGYGLSGPKATNTELLVRKNVNSTYVGNVRFHAGRLLARKHVNRNLLITINVV